MMVPFTIRLVTIPALLLSLTASPNAAAQESGEQAHIAVENPADLTSDEANRIYNSLRRRLAEGYATSGMEIVDNYQSWKRYNSAPYLSATHGQRFVNNYANAASGDYGRLKVGGTYAPGTVLAKDSVTVTTQGKVFPGALFVMEKLQSGSNPDTADWRYVMIIPDGSIYGDTTGDEPELAEYCHACHQARADDDYVFFVPEAYKIGQ
jgi:hypothetical protein